MRERTVTSSRRLTRSVIGFRSRLLTLRPRPFAVSILFPLRPLNLELQRESQIANGYCVVQAGNCSFQDIFTVSPFGFDAAENYMSQRPHTEHLAPTVLLAPEEAVAGAFGGRSCFGVILCKIETGGAELGNDDAGGCGREVSSGDEVIDGLEDDGSVNKGGVIIEGTVRGGVGELAPGFHDVELVMHDQCLVKRDISLGKDAHIGMLILLVGFQDFVKAMLV
eukprot:g38511.t1